MSKKVYGLISHDFYPYQGGLGRNASEILNMLNAADLNITIKGISPLVNSLSDHSTYLSFTKNLPADQLQFSLFLQFYLKEIIRKENLDGLILNCGPGGVFLLAHPGSELITIANHTYSQQANFVPGQRWKKIFYPLEKRTYFLADRIIAISNTTKESLIKDYSLPANKITVIPPAYNFSDIASSQQNASLKDILYIGRLEERKGILFLLETFLSNFKNFNHSTLHIVGQGSQLKNIKEMLASYPGAEKVKLHGFIKDGEINEIRANCAMQIIPSRLEGFGIVALESVSAGTPIIACNRPGLVDIIKNKTSGILVEFGDQEALSTAIQSYLATPELARSYSQNALESARKNFSHTAVIAKFRDFFASTHS